MTHKLSQRSLNKLAECHEDLLSIVLAVLGGAAAIWKTLDANFWKKIAKDTFDVVDVVKNTRAVILDVAHGENTLGKRSPDGKHREYLWSRQRVKNIIKNIQKSKTSFNIYAPFLAEKNEPGLTNRVIKYNDIARDYDHTFVLSLHNDAYGSTWSKPHGVSVWTSKGDTIADKYATSLYNYLLNVYPNEKFRPANWLNEHEKIKDPDFEANFTILAGNKYVKPLYDAVLLEWLFQTNKEDVKKLLNPIHNEYFEDMITNWIVNTFNHG